MPRRGVKSFKGRYTRRRYRSRKKSTFRIAKAALRKAKAIEGSIETKFHDFRWAPAILTANTFTGCTQFLSGTAESTTDQGGRIGDKIKPTSLFFRYQVFGTDDPSYGGSLHQDMVRVMVVKDRSGQGSTPSVSDILQTNNIQSPLHRSNTERFHVLFDKTHVLTGYDAPRGTAMVSKKKYIRLSGTTSYKGSTALVGDSDTNHYWLLAMSQNVTSPSAGRPLIQGYTRFNYKDP